MILIVLSFGFFIYILISPLQSIYILLLFLVLLHWKTSKTLLNGNGNRALLISWDIIISERNFPISSMMFAIHFLWRNSLSYKDSFYVYFSESNLLLLCFVSIINGCNVFIYLFYIYWNGYMLFSLSIKSLYSELQ